MLVLVLDDFVLDVPVVVDLLEVVTVVVVNVIVDVTVVVDMLEVVTVVVVVVLVEVHFKPHMTGQCVSANS